MQDKNREILRRYCIHVWSDTIGRILKLVRKADISKKPLHKCFICIRFAESDQQGDRLVSWMQSTVAEFGPDYGVKKQAISQTVGYENGYGTGEISVDAIGYESLTEMMLGLKAEARVKKFTFVPSRFGIANEIERIEWSNSTVSLTPRSLATVDLIFKSAFGGDEIKIAGQAYASPFTRERQGRPPVRISTNILDILLRPDKSITFTSAFDPSARTRLSTIIKYLSLRTLLECGSVELQVWWEGRRLLKGEMNASIATGEKETNRLLDSARLLVQISTNLDPETSLDAIQKSGHLEALLRFKESRSWRLSVDLDTDEISHVSRVIYWLRFNILETVFCLIGSLHVSHCETTQDGRAQLTGEGRSIICSYALDGHIRENGSMIEDDYEAYLTKSGDEELLVGIGDLGCALWS
ncbi:hypothetical protein [Zavarzinia sp. CC-PAN008]|uniref:hypothetical protein n=1 Tax=Zavarzinia sp. CC-PAN008 TaxID=3243332 RepID=UPI003F748CF8